MNFIDDFDSNVEVICDPPNNSNFSVGIETAVVCVGIDDAQNQGAPCQFTVLVIGFLFFPNNIFEQKNKKSNFFFVFFFCREKKKWGTKKNVHFRLECTSYHMS